MLAALEDLQAALFEKRKFVMQAHYLVQCPWLKALGPEGAALVERAASHTPQVARWRQWLGEPDGSSASGVELLARCRRWPARNGRTAGPRTACSTTRQWPQDKLQLIDDLEQRTLPVPVRGALLSVTPPEAICLPAGQGARPDDLWRQRVLPQSDTLHLDRLLNPLLAAIPAALTP